VSNLGRKRFLRYKKEEKKVEKLQRKLQIYSRQLNKSRELHKRIEDTLVRKIEKIQKEIDEVLVKYGEIEKNLSRL
jgi:conjugal transfer/entry exclusion protein